MLNEQRFNACFKRYVQDRKGWHYDLYACNMHSEERVNVAKTNFHNLALKNPIISMVCAADMDTCIARSSGATGIPIRQSGDLFFFRDISDDTEEKKHERLERIFVSLIRKQYDPCKNRMVELTIIKRDDRLFTLVCAVCMQTNCVDNGNGIARYLFDESDIRMYIPDAGRIQNYKKPNDDAISSYWNRVLENMPAPEKKTDDINAQKFQIDVKVLDDNIGSMLDRFVRDFGVEVRSIFFAIWAVIFSKFSLRPHFHIATHIPNRGLMFMPIALNLSKDKMTESIRSINTQLLESTEFCDCSETLINRILGFRYMDACPLSFTSVQTDDFVSFIDQNPERPSITYCRACVPSESALQIGFFFTDKYTFLEYQFDSDLISPTDMAGLDEAFRKMLTAFLEKMDYEKICSHVVKHNASDRVEDVAKIARVLESNPAFACLDAKGLATLASLCKPVSAISEDCLIEAGDNVDSLYLIEEGHIEMDAIGAESVPQPLMILKKGDLIGMEALTSERTSGNLYRVVDDTVRLISVPTHAFIEFASEHPDMWKALFSIYSGLMNRFAKMWMISS